jgi:hypothetical protein
MVQPRRTRVPGACKLLLSCGRAGFTRQLVLVALAGIAGLAPSAAAYGRARVAKPHKHAAAPFVNKVDPPPTPPTLTIGSTLGGTPAPLLGSFGGDTEFWDAFLAAAAGVAPAAKAPVVPVPGWLVGIAVKGYAVSGDMPGPGGSQPFRVGIEQVLPGGQLEVLSTSDPPFRLPGMSGLYYFNVGPPDTGFAMRLRKGNALSFDTRGGSFAVFASVPGSSTDHSFGTGQEQNAGVKWAGSAHSGVELLMQATEQPSVPVTDLEKASKALGEAEELERQALGATRAKAKAALAKSASQLTAAERLIRAAADESSEEDEEEEGAPKIPELSHDTSSSIEHYLKVAREEDGKALPTRLTISERSSRIKAGLDAKRAALSDIRKAKSLAKQVP